jgi:ATP-dependent RNA helicase DHX36
VTSTYFGHRCSHSQSHLEPTQDVGDDIERSDFQLFGSLKQDKDVSNEAIRAVGVEETNALGLLRQHGDGTRERLVKAGPAIHKVPHDEKPGYRSLNILRSSSDRKNTLIDIEIDRSNTLLMQSTLEAARQSGLTTKLEELEPEEEVPDLRKWNDRQVLTERQARRRSLSLLELRRQYKERKEFEHVRKSRAELPMSQYSSEVIDLVENNIYSIIVGATGSGKTTQVPQIVLDHHVEAETGGFCNIICTQPRRIAAISVAKRVAEERAQVLQDQVGYRIKLDARPPRPGGSITYCTTGVLLSYLQTTPDDILDHISHIIVDEVHERDMIIDFLLVTLKKTMFERIQSGKKVPRIILMSATIDSDLFASYFEIDHSEKGSVKCPTLFVPGRTFPVTEIYLDGILKALDEKYDRSQLVRMYEEATTKEYLEGEGKFSQLLLNESSVQNTQDEEEPVIRWKGGEVQIDWKKSEPISPALSPADEAKSEQTPLSLVVNTVTHIATTTEEGSILVFLPGLYEITQAHKMLLGENLLGINFGDSEKYQIFLLHSTLPEGQREVFIPSPKGRRKIILSTNIAETSITIPDVQYVVDTGKHREHTYDQHTRISQLKSTWISKSSAKQRAGRAGRVQNGHYYALFSKQRHDLLRKTGIPELLRIDLQETCLAIKAQTYKAPIREFLADAIEPPSMPAVDQAIDELIGLGALTTSEELTPLGRLLEKLPVLPALGKMIILGVIDRCLDPMIIIGASAEERPLFTHPPGSGKEADAAKAGFVADSHSDHIGLLNAFTYLRNLRNTSGENSALTFAQKSFLHFGAFKMIESTASQIEHILEEADLVPPNYTFRTQQYGVQSLNENANNEELVKALLLAGLSPRLGVRKNKNFYITPNRGKNGAIVHPFSTNQTTQLSKEEKKLWSTRQRLLTYTALSRGDSAYETFFMRDTTEVTPLMVALFGGNVSKSAISDKYKDVLNVNNFLDLAVEKGSMFYTSGNTILDFANGLRRMERNAFRNLAKKKFFASGGGRRVKDVFSEALAKLFNSDALEVEVRGMKQELAVRDKQQEELAVRELQLEIKSTLEEMAMLGDVDKDGASVNERDEGAENFSLKRIVEEWRRKRNVKQK